MYEMFAADGKKFSFLHGVVKHGLYSFLSLCLSPHPQKIKVGGKALF
jgi:hypothetical protein